MIVEPSAFDRTAVLPGVPRARGTSLAGAALLGVLMFVLMAAADLPVSQWVRDHPFSDTVKTLLRTVRWPGQYGFTVALAVLIVWPVRRHWRAAGALLAVGAVASCMTAVLKWVFGRTRPYRGHAAFDWRPFGCSPLDTLRTASLSFPSGDATLAFATAAVIAAMFPRVRWVAFGWAIAVGVTRVLQGSHYPSDVAGGALVGLTTAALLKHWYVPRRGVLPQGVATCAR